MKKPSKKERSAAREELIFYCPDGGEHRVTDPSQVECLRAIARRYNKTNGTRLPTEQAIVRAAMEVLEHPVQSLRIDWAAKQGQLAPSGLLPVKVQFDNTRQD